MAPELIVHGREPWNAETPGPLLAAGHVTSNGLHFVRCHGPVPAVDRAGYRLAVDGLVRRPLSLADLRGYPRAQVTATIVCAGNRRAELRPRPPSGVPWGPGAVGTALWGGVRLRDVLGAAGVEPAGRHVSFTGLDRVPIEAGEGSFGGSIPLEKALADEVLLADEMNGEPLPAEHGAPIRVVVPGYIGARSVKWLAAVSVERRPSTNYFHAVDYSLAGAPLGVQPLTAAICDANPTELGGLAVRGYALAGAGRSLDLVEVSADGGRSWTRADLEVPAEEPWSWRLWRVELAAAPGGGTLVVRAFDGTGQPADTDDVWNERGYMNNSWHRVHYET